MTPEQRAELKPIHANRIDGLIVRAQEGFLREVDMPHLIQALQELRAHRDNDVLLAQLREKCYRITVTIEATAPSAAHSFCGKGSTVAEAVRSLGEMMNKANSERKEQ